MEQIDVHNIINKFIEEKGYKENEHVLGVYFYGSYQLGCADEKSDIDLHVIFDDDNPKHINRGNYFIDGLRVEFFEKPLKEMYLIAMHEQKNQNNALLAIAGNSEIIFDRNGELLEFKEYVKEIFSKPLKPMTIDQTKELILMINNQMDELEKLAYNCDPFCKHVYHITLEMIRKFYHRVIGAAVIPSPKVARIYTDEYYRNLINKGIIPEQQFIDKYLDYVINDNVDFYKLITNAKDLFSYSRRNIEFDDKANCCVPIESISERVRR